MRSQFKESMPHLFQFLSSYFHEDWPCDDPTPDDVVTRFINDAGSELPNVRAELQSLLSQITDEHELGRIVFELGGYYLPTADGWTWRGWLEHVAAVLSAGEQR